MKTYWVKSQAKCCVDCGSIGTTSFGEGDVIEMFVLTAIYIKPVNVKNVNINIT